MSQSGRGNHHNNRGKYKGNNSRGNNNRGRNNRGRNNNRGHNKHKGQQLITQYTTTTTKTTPWGSTTVTTTVGHQPQHQHKYQKNTNNQHHKKDYNKDHKNKKDKKEQKKPEEKGFIGKAGDTLSKGVDSIKSAVGLGDNSDNKNQNSKQNNKQSNKGNNKQSSKGYSHNTSPNKKTKYNSNSTTNSKSYNTPHQKPYKNQSSPPYNKKQNYSTHTKYNNNNNINHSPNQNSNYTSDSSNYSNNSNISMGSTTSNSSSSSYTKSNQYKLYPLPCKSSQRWQHIVTQLTTPMNETNDLIKVLYEVAGSKQKKQLDVRGLKQLIETMMTKNERQIFFNQTLPFIKESALNLPALFPSKEVELLYSGRAITVEFTEDQVCSLLAMSFFGLHTWERGNYFPRFNITNLFGYLESVYFEKLKCILHYFYVLSVEKAKKTSNNFTTNQKTQIHRTISIYRHIPKNDQYQYLRNEYLKKNTLPLCPFEFKLSGSIEECDNSLQIDFANKYIGGGVLGSGCVQEEIRFLINPECLVSLLLCESMKTNEAIAVVGTRQFAKYKGYGSGFAFNGNYNDKTVPKAYGNYRKYRNCIVAIDAEKFYQNQLWMQYKENKMKRELLKAYTGFSIPTIETNLDETKENDKQLWIATGNWGCGVFGGDIELKCVIQWLAASLSHRKIKYFAFGDKGCKYVPSFVQILLKNKVNVGNLWQWCCNYSDYRKNASLHHPNNVMSVFEYIVQQINNIQKGNKWKLEGHPELVKKKHNDVDPSKDWHKNKYKVNMDNKESENDSRKKIENNVSKNENNIVDEHGDTQMSDLQRQDSFDDANLIDDGDQSSCGLQEDNNDQKKTSTVNSDIQDCNYNDGNMYGNNNMGDDDDDTDM